VPGLPEPELHPLLRSRWSPRVWNPTYEVTPTQVASLLEAARWAPSAGNSQPWSFIIGRRGDDSHQRVVRHLAGSSRTWAPDASLLVVNVCHLYVEGTDWEYSEFSSYDLGQAVAHMTLQAQAMGLAARQFRAFDRDALTTEFAIPAHWQIMTITAFGVVPAPATLPDGPAAPPPDDAVGRDRREMDDLVWRSSGPS
jgi:nitroreductase